jgi:hypothetical protein
MNLCLQVIMNKFEAPRALPVKALPGLNFFEVFFLILEPLD